MQSRERSGAGRQYLYLCTRCVIAGTSLKSVVVFVVVWLCVWKRFVVVCGEIVDCCPTFSARCSRIVGSPDSPLMERNAGRPIRPALYIGKGKL